MSRRRLFRSNQRTIIRGHAPGAIIVTENEARILRQALSLPPEGRAALAGSLLESLESPPDPDAEAAWATEIAKRAREIDDGAPLVPWVEARRKIVGG